MKINTIQINAGRKVFIDSNEYKIEIGMSADLEADDDFESVYYSVKNTLEGHLENWEHDIRTNDKPSIITIPQGNTISDPPLITASDMKPKLTKKKQPKKQIIQQEQILEEPELEPENENDFICPSCGEQMTQKEGKGYFLCSKHWAYPDMIQKGIVKDRKF